MRIQCWWKFPLCHTLFIDAEMLSWFRSASICLIWMFLYSKRPAWCADSKSSLGFLIQWTIRTWRPFNYMTFLDCSSYTVTEPKACIRIRKVSHLSWQCNSFLVYSKINVVLSSLNDSQQLNYFPMHSTIQPCTWCLLGSPSIKR